MIEFLHPALVSFTFPLLILSFFCETMSYFGEHKVWRFFSAFIIILCSLFSVGAYYTGMNDASLLHNKIHPNQELISAHQGIAKFYLISLIPTSLFAILRNLTASDSVHWCFVPCLVCSILLSYVTSHKGGEMVFKHGVGINTQYIQKSDLPDSTIVNQSPPAENSGDLPSP